MSCFLTHGSHGDVAGLNVVILPWVSEVVRGTTGTQICFEALQSLITLPVTVKTSSIEVESRMKMKVKAGFMEISSVCQRVQSCFSITLVPKTYQMNSS